MPGEADSPKRQWTRSNTRLDTWFERDRAHVNLETLDGRTIVEWWDEAVAEAVEDGFLNPRDYHGSAVEYANHVGAKPKRRSRGAAEVGRRMAAFDVYRGGKHVDTVYYSGSVSADEVRRELIDHDGYAPDIEVRARQRRAAEGGVPPCAHTHPPAVPTAPCDEGDPSAMGDDKPAAVAVAVAGEPPPLDNFTREYIRTALWSSNDESRPDGGDPFDENYTAADIDEKTLRKMAKDTAAFRKKAAKDLEKAYAKPDYDESYAAHDFWLTRNGHGAGFWDRGLGALGDRLSKVAKSFGTFDLYLGDDGSIHGS